MLPLSNIIISRTDSIGDVVLTLPMAKFLKQVYGDIHIAFLGKPYTRAVIEACEHIDQFIALDDFMNGEVLLAGKNPEAIVHVFPVAEIAKRAKQLNIPLRIGTKSRLFHWTTCNKLVSLSRKNSDLHEAQLNLGLLAALDTKKGYTREQIERAFDLTRLQPLKEEFTQLTDSERFKLILHPKSQGSAREWGLDHFISLIRLLDKNKVQVFISGTEKERALLGPLFEVVGDQVTDICGTMDLAQFISFINQCDGLVAASTGPLHIAAALGKHALGIYPPMRPIHPGRWAPIGRNAHVFVMNKECNDCRKSPAACHCIKEMLPMEIAACVDELIG